VNQLKVGSNFLDFCFDDHIVSTIADSGWAAHVVRLNAFPQAVRTTDCVLPQTQSTIFTAARIQLAIWWETHAVHGSEMTFEWLCTHTNKSHTEFNYNTHLKQHTNKNLAIANSQQHTQED